jgi:hypothetical protein
MNHDQLTIRAFWAPDEPETCAQFLREHRKVLEDLGITSVMGRDPQWMRSKDCIVIVAEHDHLGLVGGVRIEIARTPSAMIPLINSIGHLDPNIRTIADRFSHSGLGEICGLWNAHRFARRGLPHVLGMVAIAVSTQVNLNNLVALMAKYTLKYALRLGFRIIDEVGQSGIFEYPRPGFLGIVCGTTETAAMAQSRPDLRARIISLRLRPEQEHLEDTGSTLLNIRYRLMLRGNVIDLASYRTIQIERLKNIA